MQRRRSGAAAAAAMVLQNRQGMARMDGLQLQGALRPRMDVAWRAGQIATGLLDRLRTQSADIAYALCGSGGEGIG